MPSFHREVSLAGGNGHDDMLIAASSPPRLYMASRVVNCRCAASHHEVLPDMEEEALEMAFSVLPCVILFLELVASLTQLIIAAFDASQHTLFILLK